MLEVPWMHLCAPLEALAEFSGNRVGVLGYDAIPVVSADTVPDHETERFVNYLSVRQAHRPRRRHQRRCDRGVRRICLGGDGAGTAGSVDDLGATAGRRPRRDRRARPERVKTDAVACCVSAATSRARTTAPCCSLPKRSGARGLQFSLTFIGGGSLWYTRRFDREIARLRKDGHAVEVLRGIDDAALLRAYRDADFTVFPSLHEGYGLPVAESLALGVPVITSNYGSTAEIAADGGCLVIDPRDDDDLTAAMRRLLTDPAVLADLRAQIARRPRRTWDDFAAELWTGLVEPLAELPTGGARCAPTELARLPTLARGARRPTAPASWPRPPARVRPTRTPRSSRSSPTRSSTGGGSRDLARAVGAACRAADTRPRDRSASADCGSSLPRNSCASSLAHPVRRGRLGRRWCPRCADHHGRGVRRCAPHSAHRARHRASSVSCARRSNVGRRRTPIVLVGWGSTYGGLRELSAPERAECPLRDESAREEAARPAK